MTARTASFLSSAAAGQWSRLGAHRRAGVCAPLFSLHSRRSVGVGEYLDLPLLADWCVATGQTIIQLLPLNDLGFDFAPYSSQSSFALEPVHLSLDRLRGVDAAPFEGDLADLRCRFPVGRRVNFAIKRAKLELLWRMFESSRIDEDSAFRSYRDRNVAWLPDLALYKAMKERFGQASWESWEPRFRVRDEGALAAFGRENARIVLFHEWLQWQCAEQLEEAHRLCHAKGVYLMGDLPFLVARDSADVWAFQSCFKLDLSSGAPPDLYFAGGQRWGMPAYDWDRIAADGWRYLVQKLKCAERYFDLFRVDHVIGVFRLYTIPITEPAESMGSNGRFDPADKDHWEEHGRRILKVMLDHTHMLPCGEDLGVVPKCSYKVLAEFGIPGLEVQRWSRDWEGAAEFNPAGEYRVNSVAVLSTHDMSVFDAWWRDEAGTLDEALFRKNCAKHNLNADELIPKLFDAARSRGGRLRWRSDATRENFLWTLSRHENDVKALLGDHKTTFTEREQFWRFAGMPGKPSEEPSPELLGCALEKSAESSAVFSIQLLQDYLSLGGALPGDPVEWRVNMPGTQGPQNWSCVLPAALEEMASLPINDHLRELHRRTGRDAAH